MENCIHNIDVKTDNGNVITYCTKCGKIFSVQPTHITEVSNNNNNGKILLE